MARLPTALAQNTPPPAHPCVSSSGGVEDDPRTRSPTWAPHLSKVEVVHVHRKLYLPTYGLFDEGRFFAQGDQVRAFDTRFGRFGILICEDFWHASPPYLLWLWRARR